MELKEICPLWAKRIKKEPIDELIYDVRRSKHTLAIGDVTKCIVSEAYDFNHIALCECRICEGICYDFYDIIYDKSKERLEEKIAEFEEHWTEKHT